MALSIPFTPSPQWLRDRKEHTERVNRLLRFKFSGLWRARHGGCSFISDDDEGRTMLKVLLRFRTTAESAMESAPWLAEREFKTLRKAGHKIPWGEIGKLIKLTDAERTAHKLFYWMPIDVPPEEVRRRQLQKNMEKDRERKRKVREKNKELQDMLSNNNDRKDAILRMLAGKDAPPSLRDSLKAASTARYSPRGNGWTDVPALVERAKTIAAFLRGPDGWSVKHRSLRPIVHRTLQQLQKQGEIEIEMGVGKRGPVAFARLRGVMRTGFVTVTA